MSESYFYWKPVSKLGEQAAGESPDAVGVSGYLDAETYIVPSGYTQIFDGKRVVVSGAFGDEVHMGVKPGEYPDTESERQKRAGYLSRVPSK